MDATTVLVAAIAAVPATIAALASLVSARRSKEARRASVAAGGKSETATQAVTGHTERLNADLTFLIHMLSDHISDTERHVHKQQRRK